MGRWQFLEGRGRLAVATAVATGLGEFAAAFLEAEETAAGEPDRSEGGEEDPE